MLPQKVLGGLGIVVHACNPVLRRLRQEDVSLHYMVSSRPAWAIAKPCLKKPKDWKCSLVVQCASGRPCTQSSALKGKKALGRICSRSLS
jgi:hypothetical protein